MRHLHVVVVLALLGCGGSPTAPLPAQQQQGPGVPHAAPMLATGRWSTGSACMNVTESTVDFYAGCWHGQFNRPQIVADAFTIEGTYQFEAGPTRDESGSNARFVGSLSGETLTLRVERSTPAINEQPLTYVLELGEGTCQRLCN